MAQGEDGFSGHGRQPAAEPLRHALVVRVTHWINAVCFLLLLPTGAIILREHPELYWGETGYYGDPAFLRLPIAMSINHSALGRNLHFAAAWLLVISTTIYLVSGLLSGHVRRDLLPLLSQLAPAHLWDSIRRHARLERPTGAALRSYDVLQRLAYLLVIFGLLPVMLLSGLTLSPGFTAAFPGLFALFGGRQSARTIHFLCANALVAFLAVHLFQVIVAGGATLMRGMITGRLPTAPVRPAS